MKDLLGRRRRPGERGVDRAPRLAVAQRRDEPEARAVRKHHRLADRERHLVDVIAARCPAPTWAISSAAAIHRARPVDLRPPARASMTSIITANPVALDERAARGPPRPITLRAR